MCRDEWDLLSQQGELDDFMTSQEQMNLGGGGPGLNG